MKYRKYNKFNNLELLDYKKRLESNCEAIRRELAKLDYILATLSEELKERVMDLEWDILEAEDDRMTENYLLTTIN